MGFSLCEKWARKISEEFMNQYRNEGEQGLPLTKMWEEIDTPLGFLKSQLSFGDFIVAPLWNHVIAIYPELQSEGGLGDSLGYNKSCWQAMKNEIENPEKK